MKNHNSDEDLPPINANKTYEKKLSEVYKGIEIFKEEDTGFYRANFNGKEYDTTYLDSIKDDIDDFVNNQPIGTSKKIRQEELNKKIKNKPSTYKQSYVEMKSNFEILLTCYLYLQGFTYFLSIPKWFLSLSMDTNFWFGFKGLVIALIPVVNIFYASDWFATIFNFIGITLEVIISLVKVVFSSIKSLFV